MYTHDLIIIIYAVSYFLCVFMEQVGEIQFKNSYVAYLTVRVKQKPPADINGTENTPAASKFISVYKNLCLIYICHVTLQYF